MTLKNLPFKMQDEPCIPLGGQNEISIHQYDHPEKGLKRQNENKRLKLIFLGDIGIGWLYNNSEYRFPGWNRV